MKTFVIKKYYVLILFTTLVFSCTNDDGSNSIQDQNFISQSEMAEEILDIVNTHRQGLGKESLISNDLATQLAVEHTQYMITISDINHDNFEERKVELSTSENATIMGENVAVGFNTAAAVVQGWLDSEGHRENIEGNYTHTGIAVLKNEDGKHYFTQIFYR